MLSIPTGKHVSVAVAVLLAVGIWVLFMLLARSPGSIRVVDIVVAPGATMRQVATQMHEKELIRSVWVTLVYAQVRGLDSSIQAGIYELTPSMSVFELIDRMVSGDARSTDISITIPEGLNVWEIDARLRSGGMTWRLGAFAQGALAYEGQLFPETYRLSPDATVEEVIDIMRKEGARRMEGYSQQDVIIASLLEKEAKTLSDMKLVAGIIAKRMEIGMLLQLDASVAYGWCRRVAAPGRLCDVTRAPLISEIPKDGPYNVYARPGLPVGPIGNPGLSALEAATHPTASDYLYYLSTRDGSRIIFSKTLQEHNANRRQHLGL